MQTGYHRRFNAIKYFEYFDYTCGRLEPHIGITFLDGEQLALFVARDQ